MWAQACEPYSGLYGFLLSESEAADRSTDLDALVKLQRQVRLCVSVDTGVVMVPCTVRGN